MWTFMRTLLVPEIGRPTGLGHRGDGAHLGRLYRAAILLSITMLALAIAQGCSDDASDQEASRDAVVTALDTLATELSEDRPADAAAYSERLQVYLEDHPSFFGSAAALLDRSGAVITSPYVYRAADGYATTDLAVPSYNIEAQDWFTEPLATDASVWTDPYFDAGGGEVWMITRSVPVRDAEGIFAIITTDLVVDEPNQ